MDGVVAASGGVSAGTWLKCKKIESRKRMLSESWVSIEGERKGKS